MPASSKRCQRGTRPRAERQSAPTVPNQTGALASEHSLKGAVLDLRFTLQELPESIDSDRETTQLRPDVVGSSSKVDRAQAFVGDSDHPGAFGLSRDQGCHQRPVLDEDLEAVRCRLAPSSGEHEPANSMLDP